MLANLSNNDKAGIFSLLALGLTIHLGVSKPVV
jgi:hypothetical protein